MKKQRRNKTREASVTPAGTPQPPPATEHCQQWGAPSNDLTQERWRNKQPTNQLASHTAAMLRVTSTAHVTHWHRCDVTMPLCITLRASSPAFQYIGRAGRGSVRRNYCGIPWWAQRRKEHGWSVMCDEDLERLSQRKRVSDEDNMSLILSVSFPMFYLLSSFSFFLLFVYRISRFIIHLLRRM